MHKNYGNYIFNTEKMKRKVVWVTLMSVYVSYVNLFLEKENEIYYYFIIYSQVWSLFYTETCLLESKPSLM